MFGLPIPEFLIKPLAFLLAALALLLIGRAWGQHAVYEEWLEANSMAAAAAVVIVGKQGAVTAKVVTVYRDRVQLVEGVTQTITKEVPVYVTEKSDAACVIPVGFVRIHDAAATSAVPATAAGDNERPSGVALSAVAETVTFNYGASYKIREQLNACRSWIREQFLATNGEALP